MSMLTPRPYLIYTGVLDLNIISNDTILLMISISTTFSLPIKSRVSNEAKFFQEVNFKVLCAVFHSELRNLEKTLHF